MMMLFTAVVVVVSRDLDGDLRGQRAASLVTTYTFIYTRNTPHRNAEKRDVMRRVLRTVVRRLGLYAGALFICGAVCVSVFLCVCMGACMYF